jgi:hypothetical protein
MRTRLLSALAISDRQPSGPGLPALPTSSGRAILVRPTGEYRWERAVANRALELIGKELGMFLSREEIDQTVKVIAGIPLGVAGEMVAEDDGERPRQGGRWMSYCSAR